MSGRTAGTPKVLIATGGRSRRLGLPGAGLPGIHYLRTVAECDAIKREAVPGRRAVVVGMGFIGCEVAASLTQMGVRVTAVFPGRSPLETVRGSEVGALIGAIHREKGVETLAGERPPSRFRTGSWPTRSAGPAHPASTRLVTWRTISTRCSGGSG
jgi:3-phenylpropionate/trans-cinnamate dioxygenase ferredoxin reductase subunit